MLYCRSLISIEIWSSIDNGAAFELVLSEQVIKKIAAEGDKAGTQVSLQLKRLFELFERQYETSVPCIVGNYLMLLFVSGFKRVVWWTFWSGGRLR